MSYSDRIAHIENLTVEEIIANCKQYVPSQHQRAPYYHPALCHGVELLVTDDALDCYMAAYGEMHQSKCRAALQNMPFPPANNQQTSLALEIVDWGCGQGIGTISVLDYLKERSLTQWLKRVTLIEPSEAALDRAAANVAKATGLGVQIDTINEYLPAIDSSEEFVGINYTQGIVIHIFSNILDVDGIDLGKLAKALVAPGRTHYVLCMGPLNANAFRMDRFCDIFHPSSFFSNISDKGFGRTTDTGYTYTCKTKAFVYEGTSLDLTRYNAHEKAQMQVYGEYDVNLQIQNQLLSRDEGWVYWRLQQILAPNDILYVKPDINGTVPDFVIARPNVGIIIVSVFEVPLADCERDQKTGLIAVDGMQLESPYSELNFAHDLILGSSKSLTEGVVADNRNLGLVKKVLICSQGTARQCHDLIGRNGSITVYGSEFIKDDNVSARMFDYLRFFYRTQYFDDTALNELKRRLSPQWHTYREGVEVRLTTPQKNLSKSEAASQRKISGVAGAGKTQVLATRAVNAQIRTGGDVLLLTFNITLANYMRMRVGQVRADFPWNKIHIDYYHRFFRKHAHANNLRMYGIGPYYNVQFFESAANRLPRYDAILIDEVQDYETTWLQILRQYFLKPDGEFVVFGDPKQNIYHRPLDAEGNIRLGVIPGMWNKELSKGHRFTNLALANLATKFQQSFHNITDAIETDAPTRSADAGFQFNLLHYIHLQQSDDVYSQVYDICLNFIQSNNFNPKDVAIIAPQTEILRYMDYRYRTESGNQTTITFVDKENMALISRHQNQASYEFKRDHDRLERAQKNRFTMATRHLKLSTIQSFKGWEAPTIICIIQNDIFNDDNVVTSPELIYTGITRAKENLLVINIGENCFHNFFSANLQQL